MRGFRLSRLLLILLALYLALGSAARFGFRSNPGQCPTAPIQRMAFMSRTTDGGSVLEYRAPRPGETGFMVCHCQEKRAASQTGWFVPTFTPLITVESVQIDTPIGISCWVRPEPAWSTPDPPGTPISHPPAA